MKENHNLDDYDTFILGSPSYADSYAKEVTDYLEKNFNFSKKETKFITYVTHSFWTEYGHLHMKEYLEKKEMKVVGAKDFYLPNNFHMNYGIKETAEQIKEIYKVVNKEIKSLVEDFFNEKTQIDERASLRINLVKLKYKVVKNIFIPRFAKMIFSVDEEKCKLCNICVKECPSDNISIEDGKIKFSNDCLACGRCIHVCPFNAYKVKKKSFEQYNYKQKPILEQLK